MDDLALYTAVHPTHDPIPLRSTGMAQEAQICTCCASAVPEVLAQPCVCPADDDRAVDFGAAIAALAVACATDDVAEVIHKAMALAAALENFMAAAPRPGLRTDIKIWNQLDGPVEVSIWEEDGPYDYESWTGPTATEALTTALRAHTPKEKP